MTCEVCGRPEPLEYLRIGFEVAKNGAPRNACRRCRLDPAHRPLWDAMCAAEAAVIADPESSDAFGRLLRARVTFDVAVRPRGKLRKRGRR